MSWENPNLLPIWEAQFGDFFNGAQVIVDTFVTSSQTKWLKQSALVMLLPHGLDGAGPEHSSCRIERMLQLTNDPYEYHEAPIDVNVHVVNPTTSGQYFHLLRRQLKRNHRKPLIVASPKGLLRFGPSTSTLQDLGPGTKFHPVLTTLLPSNLRKVILVSGKVYYDLLREIEIRSLQAEIGLVRLEEICPFPFKPLAEALRTLTSETPNLPEICWVQEEPRNQGGFGYVSPRISAVLEKLGWEGARLRYAGRQESEVPAVGVASMHAQEKNDIIQGVLL